MGSLPDGPVSYHGGALRIEGVAASRIAAFAGTPVYAYSASEIRRRYREFDACLGARLSRRKRLILYAVKANPSLSVLKLLFSEGAGAEVVSGGELARALAAGCSPSKIVFSGVGKTADEMRRALKAGILAFNVESAEEALLLETTARALRRPASFAVRVTPEVRGAGHRHIATGTSDTKFGVPRREALAIYRRWASSRWLRPVGLHCHIGSQITSARPYAKALELALGLVDELLALGISLSHLDMGGGMGIAYEGLRSLEMPELAAVLAKGLTGRPGLRLVLEPGRWLVGPAGVLLTKVLYRKGTPRRRFVVVDAAMNDLLRPALYEAHHPIVPVRPGKPAGPVDLVGPVCESADFLARGRRLPGLFPGDLLAVLQTGAYGFSMSSQYNSRPRVAEVMVEGRRLRLIRRRETFADLVRNER